LAPLMLQAREMDGNQEIPPGCFQVWLVLVLLQVHNLMQSRLAIPYQRLVYHFRQNVKKLVLVLTVLHQILPHNLKYMHIAVLFKLVLVLVYLLSVHQNRK
tara:strand:+ start:587 stop:889 length:303 start_codon:yes stop_codon:yes gene_type:complete